MSSWSEGLPSQLSTSISVNIEFKTFSWLRFPCVHIDGRKCSKLSETLLSSKCAIGSELGKWSLLISRWEPGKLSTIEAWHCTTKKKCLSQRSERHIYSGSWRLMEQPYVGRFSRSSLERGVCTPKVSDFGYFVLIFAFVMVSMRILETYIIDISHSWQEHQKFFLEFLVHTLL